MLPPVRVVFALLLTWAPLAQAMPATTAFLDEHCVDCHEPGLKKGGLDLTALDWDPDKRESFDTWVKVVDMLERGMMPPKKKPRPDAAASQSFLASIGKELRTTEAQRQSQTGRAVLRRLNRQEYERTVQELLGINIPLAELLPEDTPMHGFDTVAEGLRLSTLQMEKYLEAADIALDAAIELGPEPERIKKRWQLKDEKDVRKQLDTPEGTQTDPNNPKDKHRHVLGELPDAIVYFNEGYPTAQVRDSGRHPAGMYRVRISAYGYQSGGKSIPMRVYGDNYREKQFLGWFDMPPDQPRVVEFTALLKDNEHIHIQPSNTGLDENGKGVYNVPVAGFTGAGLALQWVELEGPLDTSWPPIRTKQLFGDIPLEKIEDSKWRHNKRIAYQLVPGESHKAARDVIERLATRAFRRPLEAGDADRFVKLATDELDAGEPFVEAVRVGMRGVLAAPQFLLFQEAPGKLDEYALASRLSYFLWSSMPDEELLTAAAGKRLSDPKVLQAQVERMLRSEKSRAFVRNFTGQWLDLRNIDATSPDTKLYPEADELLKISMVQESEAFFAELLDHDLKVTNVIHSDFAMLNSRLGAHYGIDGVEGEQFRKVQLPQDSPRGGVLTQAGVLKVTANGTTTSPVMRGAWVLKKLMGQPPSPPPPGIGSIEPDTRGATTVREQLAKHRDSESCASCHQQIDPPGFALESFDVIGGYRDRYRSQDKGETIEVKNSPRKRHYVKLGQPVDATGETSDGRPFTTIQEFKQLLLADSDQVLTSLTGKIATYGTGAGISFADRPAVQEIVQKVRQKGGGLRTLVHEVVQSPIFQNK